jgi:hypothetical protein
MLVSCNTNTTNSNRSGYSQEVIELAKQYRFNTEIDTVNLYSLNAQVFQTIFDTEGLCNEKGRVLYSGQTLYYISNEQLYDDKIINKSVVYLGTYRYEGKDSDYHVVPLYCDIEVYKNGIVDKIKEIQSSDNE